MLTLADITAQQVSLPRCEFPRNHSGGLPLRPPDELHYIAWAKFNLLPGLTAYRKVRKTLGRESSVLAKNTAIDWNRSEMRILTRFKAPVDIQNWLNRLRYNDKATAMSPRRVMREGTAHCFEGALFGAAGLRFLGYPPLIVDLRAHNDDDHVISVFRINSLWGAVAKSNTTLLRFREPVYRSLRELVMSYFEMYFNTKGDKSLMNYSRTVNLCKYDHRRWMTCEEDLDYIGEDLDAIPHTDVVPHAQRGMLSPADRDIQKACFLGSRKSGLYKPR